MGSSPCGGCPPCCPDCVFDHKPSTATAQPSIVMEKEAYGCIRPDAGPLVVSDNTLGMMRGSHFHPVTERGASFLKEQNNPLGQLC